MSLVPPHQARRQGHADQHGCPGDRPLKQGLIANVASQLLPPHLQKAALPASSAEQPAGTGTFQFEAEATRNLHSFAPQLEHGRVNTDIADNTRLVPSVACTESGVLILDPERSGRI
ncbi:MAG: hypothetical protein ACJ0GQ_05910 [Parasynechococcus sp.]